MDVRRPAVAGTFYRGDPRMLRAQVEECFAHDLGPGAVPQVDADGPGLLRGLLCPHAALQYSGPAAAWAYADLARDGPPEVIALVGPNHTGMGHAVAVSAASAWNLPLGDVPVDSAVRDRILAEAPNAQLDDGAHRFEHSLEVQLPFLHYLFGGRVAIVPIALRMVSARAGESAAALRVERLGQAIANALEGRRGLVIASSDMTHFESQQAAQEKDRAVLERLSELEAGRMLDEVDARDVSMCGVMAAATAIHAVRAMGARSASLLAYHTSGDITGDQREVVGYAAASFSAEGS